MKKNKNIPKNLIPQKKFEKLVNKIDANEYYMTRDYICIDHKWYVKRWKLYKVLMGEGYYDEFNKEILDSSFSNFKELRYFVNLHNKNSFINKIKKFLGGIKK